MHRTAPVDAFARAHHGLVTRQAATAGGIAASTWRRWVATGRLVLVHESVGRLPSFPVTDEQTVLAAVLTCGPGASASMSTAAWLWDITGFEGLPVHVTVLSRTRHRVAPDVHVHRPLDLADLHPAMRRGIPTTNPLRLLCDLGAEHDDGVVADALERLLVARVVTVTSVRATISRHARPGRAGIGPLRRALEDRLLDDRPADSVLEVTFARLLSDHGLPAARFHAHVGGVEVDFCFPTERVVVELDGRSYHGRAADFERDRIRDVKLHALGYVVLRFTWAQVVRRPAWVADQIARTLAVRTAG